MRLKKDAEVDGRSIEPYRNLANGIVLQACEDYLNNTITENSFKFFCFGEWIQMLTEIDGEFIFNKMRGKKHDRERY